MPCSLVIGAAVFFLGLGWGLPSRNADAIMFGGRPAAAGLGLVSLSATQPATAPSPAGNQPVQARGADVDRTPLQRPKDRLVALNDDITGQAEIIRRYRLFSYQPDEMITFMSLAQMRPSAFDFDPRLYQYGGLWIYPVGFGLRLGAMLGLIDLKGGGSGVAYYLDAPEAFGRFYVVARLYVMAWGLVGVATVFSILRRLTGGNAWAAFAGAIAFIALPVVVNASHEAKPHLGGMVLVLLAALSAAKWVARGLTFDLVLTGIFCGLAVGMVLSTAPVMVLLPVMVCLRPESWQTRIGNLAAAAFTALLAYALTNPYVFFHLLHRDLDTLQSNLGNSKAFYQVGRVGEGVLNVARLIAEGMSVPLAVVATVAAAWIVMRLLRHLRRQATLQDAEVLGVLIAIPAVLNAAQIALVAAGKPGELGRFLLLTDVALVIGLFAVLASIPLSRPRAVAIAVAALVPMWWGARYLSGFAKDAGPSSSRLVTAQVVEQLRLAGAKRLILTTEPAPYAVPPFNVFDWPVLLTPKDADPQQFVQPGDVVVQVMEGDTPISWANKPFAVRQMK